MTLAKRCRPLLQISARFPVGRSTISDPSYLIVAVNRPITLLSPVTRFNRISSN